MIILFFPDIPWHSLYQRPQHIAARLAGHWPVLWVEPATLSQKMSFRPARVHGNLYRVSLPFFPYNARNVRVKLLTRVLSRWRIARWGLAHLQRWLLRRALVRLGISDQEIGFFVQNIQATRLAPLFNPRVVVFDYIDNLFGFTEFPPHVRTEWRQTIQRADIVVATSPTLKNLLQAEHPVTVHVVTNGVEYSRFASATTGRPADLPSPDSPIAGYIGSVYPWLDFSLLHMLLTLLPAMNLVMIGHDHPDVQEQLRSLREHPNFFFLGVRPYADIPAYLHCFSVALIPFRKTPLTAGVNPVKLYEYSAAGVQTIATDFSGDMKGFGDIVTIADTPKRFLEAVRSVIHAGQDPVRAATRRAFAEQNDWDQKFSVILSLLQRHISGVAHND